MNKRVIGKRIVAYILVFALFFINCYPSEVFAANNNNNSTNSNNSDKVKYQKKNKSNQKIDIIVKYKDVNKKDKTINEAKSKSKASKLEQKRYFGKQKIGVYEINTSDNRDAVIEELNNDPNVEYAQPNYPLSIESIPTDSKLTNQWSLYNDGQSVDGIAGRATVDINALNAWNITMGSSDVIVGVLDSGIDISHSDLKNNIYINKGEIKGNGIDDDGNGYIDDINGWDFSNDDLTVFDSLSTDTHGTYIAGIIAASADDEGVVGVAPKVKVLPLKFISGTTGYTSDAIEAIEYAMNMGVKIMNCSFGGTDDNQALKDAMKNSGMLFICSAGNGGNDTANKSLYPAGFDISNVISVTAIDSNGVLPSFSNFGTNVDIAAPGTSILSTTPNNSYNYYSGTSTAAAVVSGIAALVKSAMPEKSITGIKDQIINYVTPSSSLTNKVNSGGRVDAFGALSGTAQPIDVYAGTSNSSDVLPTEGEGKDDTWYIMDERASNVERFHYGEGGVSPASGNYSVTCTDMSVIAPGFTVNISRSYNSRNTKQTLLGSGWTFGFEGSLVNKGDEIEVNLPNGSSHVFHFKNGSYAAEGTRAVLVKNADNSFILTTQDQYKYGFDSTTYKMTYMEDKNGNQLILTYTSGKLTKITDTVGRSYLFAYNAKNLLSTVTDPAGRITAYEYNASNLLNKVTDPQGGSLLYSYDSSGYLTTLIDQNNVTFQQITYSHDYGDAQNKVSKTTDGAGETWLYSYDVNNRSTTITNNANKKWTYWFDAAMYTIRVQDPEGKSTKTEYAFNNNNNYYGDLLATEDRNGNRTEYVVDLTTGNTIKITNPDGGVKQFVYDKWNNVIEEVDEGGSRTYNIYDTDGKNLLKQVRPIDGIRNYADGDIENFAVTNNIYYTKTEALSLFNCNVAGLLKSTTDPEGKTTIYTYDGYGNTASVAVSGTKITYTYDILGNKLTETTLEGSQTQYVYDKNSLLIKETNPDGGVNRTVYDATGKIKLEVAPNQYEVAKDNLVTGIYSGSSGTKYEWYPNGYQKTITDVEGYITSFTWDVFGNKISETKPNGSIYRYEYDSINRLTKTYFKDNNASTEVLLSEISYGILSNGTTQTNTTEYMDENQKSTVISIKDYADREVMIQYGDYSRSSTVYNLDGSIKQSSDANGAITYYNYDALGNLTDKWAPSSIENGTTMYSWTGYTYDKAGNKLTESTGKSTVTLNNTAQDIYRKNYAYINGLLMSQTDSDGRSTSYQYDGEGRVKQETLLIDSSKTQSSEYSYNYLGKTTSITSKIRKGDIAGNSYSDNNILDVVTTNQYDVSGNLLKTKDAAGNVTEYTYDKLDRVLSIKKELKDSTGQVISQILTSKTYNWDGQVATATDAKGNHTSYTYDAKGNQIKVTDARGSVTYKAYDRQGRNTVIIAPENYKADTPVSEMERTEFTYDVLDRVVKQTEVYQRMTLSADYEWEKTWVNIASKTLRYDTLGNVISDTDALGNTTESDYNLAGKLERVTEPESKEQGLDYTVRYSYNGLGQKIKESYPGSTYSYSYDGVGNLLTTSINGNTKSLLSYDKLGRVTSSTDANGNTTTTEWNTFGKMSKTVTPGDETIAENQTIYQYDLIGNLISSRDTKGTVVSFTYDSLGRNLSQTTSDGTTTNKITQSTTYDQNGNILTQTDGRENITVNTYDSLNRKVSTTNALLQKTEYTYDKNGNLIIEKDFRGNETKSLYDGINRLVEKQDALGNIIHQLIYNDVNAQISSYDALHNNTQYFYDKNKRQIKVIDAEGNSTTTAYDSRGNIKKQKDEKGNATIFAYDGENRLIKVVDALGNTTSYTYDGVGNLLSQMDGNGNATTYQYNVANLPISKIDPEGNANSAKTEHYTYYANGLMATKTDRNGVVTVYLYDVFGRKLSENADGDLQFYRYDNNANLLTMSNLLSNSARTYDPLNRLTSDTVSSIGKSIYEYDLAADTEGEYKERTTDPKGNITLKTYDKVGRLSKVTVDGKTTAYKYLANGTRSKVIYPDGTTETYSYDKKNQVKQLINAKANGTIISSFTYTYDEVGNQLSKTQKNGTTTYTYDALNRLSSVTEPEGKITSYTYDGAGNRKTENVTIGSGTTDILYTYNSQNRLVSTFATGGAVTKYLYDNNGNLITKTKEVIKALSTEGILTEKDLSKYGLIIKKETEKGTGAEEITQYRYDRYNRLISTKSKSNSASYTYNAQGYRISKSVNGELTRYLFQNDKVVLETDADNKQKAFQVYGSNLLYREAGSETGAQGYYYLYNAHGDVTELIDTKGIIAVSYDYDAFGNILSQVGEANNNILYAGYQYDEESGLYYLNARYYDSVTARFMSEDTYTGERNDPLSLNLYTYCHNNPITYDDPSGHFLHILVGALVGGIVNTAITAAGDFLDDGKINKGWKSYAGAAAEGAITGGAAAATGGASLAVTLTVGGAASAAGNAANQYISTGKVNAKQVVTSAVTSVASGAAGHVAGNVVNKVSGKTTTNIISKSSSKTDDVAKNANILKPKGKIDTISNTKNTISKASTDTSSKYQKASLFERLTTKKTNVSNLKANPYDEFSNPKIGPSNSAVSKYMKEIGTTGKIKEPITVQKLSAGGYEIVNGHHRWLAAQKSVLDKVPIKIKNYKN